MLDENPAFGVEMIAILEKKDFETLSESNAFKSPMAADKNEKMVDAILNALSEPTDKSILNFNLLMKSRVLEKFLEVPQSRLNKGGIPGIIQALALRDRIKANQWILKLLARPYSYLHTPDYVIKDYLQILFNSKYEMLDTAMLAYLKQHHPANPEQNLTYAYTIWIVDFINSQLNNRYISTFLSTGFINILDKADKEGLNKSINHYLTQTLEKPIKDFMVNLRKELNKPNARPATSQRAHSFSSEQKHSATFFTQPPTQATLLIPVQRREFTPQLFAHSSQQPGLLFCCPIYQMSLAQQYNKRYY